MKRLRFLIAGGSVFAGAGLLFMVSPRLGGFALIGAALVAVAVVAFRVLWRQAGRMPGPGRMTGHRLLGAGLAYLNVAILAAIAWPLVTGIWGRGGGPSTRE